MNLDDKKIFEKLDKHQVAKSIEFLPDQIRQVLESEKVKTTADYSGVNKVVLAGMGGSNLGIRIIRNAFSDNIKLPINISAGYGVPAYVDSKTLFIMSSYSGSTEETLSAYSLAKKRKAKIMAITENNPKSKLAILMEKENIPGLMFSPDYNPCGQPRMGLGYAIMGTALILAKAGVLKIDKQEIQKIIEMLEINSRRLRVEYEASRNIAKKTALSLDGYLPILVGAEHLSGNLHVMRNQINENAKTFSSYLVLPDMNHYAMEGLVNPPSCKKNLMLVFFDSDLYDAKIRRRLELTVSVAEKNNIRCQKITLKSETKKAQCFELLQLGCWISYYLGAVYGVDPVAIPYVDWFKENLK